jgi:SAM-dependent methyltransferase
MDVLDFVLAHVRQPPARILEVGCGAGELALALAQRGFDVTAIDPDAPNGAIFRKETLESFSESANFDAVVASRSLHHIESLERGLDKIHDLLRPGGLLVLNEFAWDQMDEATARWYRAHMGEPTHKDESLLPDNFPGAWVEEHQDMHTSLAMREALDARFESQSFEWLPYMAEHYLKRDDLIAEERNQIDSRKIKPIGFRYVGRRTG